MIPLKPFYLLRHGETVANAEGYAAGSLDTPLTEKGREQAILTQKTLLGLDRKPQIIFHSPLSRAKDTAALANLALDLQMIPHAGLKEQDYGDWRGQQWDIVKPLMKEGMDPPNGEPKAAFYARARNALAECLEQTALLPLIVAHGGIIDAMWDHVGIPLMDAPNCALYEFAPSAAEQHLHWRWTHHGPRA